GGPTRTGPTRTGPTPTTPAPAGSTPAGPTPTGSRPTTASKVFSTSQIAEAGERVFGVNPQQPAGGSTTRKGSGPPGPALAP
ncbi:MAG: hypothetical protein JWN15_3694, partial [Firmicutes bacterium]|nr:hypothetical protein [Bacillota bacterium]